MLWANGFGIPLRGEAGPGDVLYSFLGIYDSHGMNIYFCWQSCLLLHVHDCVGLLSIINHPHRQRLLVSLSLH